MIILITIKIIMIILITIKIIMIIESVREAFKDTSINVTVQGQKHLGAAIGSREYLEEYVSEKVTNWINDIAKLAEFSQPQACSAAYTFGLKHRWTYSFSPTNIGGGVGQGVAVCP